ncbi:MAG: DNA-binding protein [Planctomycetales bacterium 4572_13]|nr:MAG: DNA-binding protein [Planctomycetales bacterium 4572_13]
MKPRHIKLAREQLDATLGHFEPLKTLVPPGKGWIRAIRDAVGMTGSQLANRLNVNKQRVSRIEHDEKLGKVKIETLRNVAVAMDCVFVYAFVPRDSLDQAVGRQAEKIAKKRMARSNQMMRLEKQELSDSEKARAMQTIIDEIVETMPKSLWDQE